jgi:hypothetical protein
MATDRFDYRNLPGVVSREMAEAALDLTSVTATAGLLVATCPVCAGVLHCKPLPGDLCDIYCIDGCGPQEVTAALKEQAGVEK